MSEISWSEGENRTQQHITTAQCREKREALVACNNRQSSDYPSMMSIFFNSRDWIHGGRALYFTHVLPEKGRCEFSVGWCQVTRHSLYPVVFLFRCYARLASLFEVWDCMDWVAVWIGGLFSILQMCIASHLA